MRRYPRIAAALAMILTLSGCTSLSLNGPDILTPPHAAGDRAEIQQLIEERTDGSYNLLYPSRGEYKSGVILYNIDGDSDDEAIALYASADMQAHILFAEKRGGRYAAVGGGDLGQVSIDCISFADLNADGRAEVLLGCGTGAATSTLSVFDVGEQVIRTDVATGYTDYLCGDFDGNSAEDILLLMPQTAEGTSTARLIIHADGAYSEKSRCEIDSTVTSYAGLRFGSLSAAVQGAVLDGMSDDGVYSTQVIYYDAAQHSLQNPVFIYTGYEDTKRTSPILSTDIDGDGILDIPLCSLCEYSDKEDTAAVCRRVSWSAYRFEDMRLEETQRDILCEELGFLFRIDERHIDIVTARYSGENAMTVYLWEYKDNVPTRTSKLLTVKRYDKSSFDPDRIIEAVLYENNTDIYTYTIDSTSSYISYTDDEVKSDFIPTDKP